MTQKLKLLILMLMLVGCGNGKFSSVGDSVEDEFEEAHDSIFGGAGGSGSEGSSGGSQFTGGDTGGSDPVSNDHNVSFLGTGTLYDPDSSIPDGWTILDGTDIPDWEVYLEPSMVVTFPNTFEVFVSGDVSEKTDTLSILGVSVTLSGISEIKGFDLGLIVQDPNNPDDETAPYAGNSYGKVTRVDLPGSMPDMVETELNGLSQTDRLPVLVHPGDPSDDVFYFHRADSLITLGLQADVQGIPVEEYERDEIQRPGAYAQYCSVPVKVYVTVNTDRGKFLYVEPEWQFIPCDVTGN